MFTALPPAAPEPSRELRDAALKGDLASLARLLASSAARDDIDAVSWGGTPLHVAAEGGEVGVAQLLLEHGADANARTPYRLCEHKGWTPLHLAISNGHLDVVRLLLQHGASVDAVLVESGDTPLHQALRGWQAPCFESAVPAEVRFPHLFRWRHSRERSREIAALLLRHGAEANAVNREGETPLHVVVGMADCAGARLLLDHGADVDARGPAGATPLCRAWGPTLFWLLQHGACGADSVEDPTPLARVVHCGTHEGAWDATLRLLWRGAEPARVPAEPAPTPPSAGQLLWAPAGPPPPNMARRVLARWCRGELRCWSRAEHAAFPPPFRADVAATLLATLGSGDADAGECLPGEPAPLLRNPLSLLRNHSLLKPLFEALLVLHMGGPPAAVRPEQALIEPLPLA